MKLYLMRHGHALSAAEAKVQHDADRPLSDRGQDDIRSMARYLSIRGAAPGVILHSPALRACQTAEEAARAWTPPRPMESFEPLSNVLGPEELLTKIRERAGELAEVMAVGHQPQLGELAQHLSGDAFALRPGGVIALELQGGGGRKLWSFNPEDLRGL